MSIVGAGATGVELSAELMEAYHEIQVATSSKQHFHIRITLIEGAPRMLAGRNFFIEGLIAKYMYMSLHLMHHKVILGWRKTALLALGRIFQNRVSGRLKLR